MKSADILWFGDPCLRQKTKEVIDFDKRIYNQIDNMWKVLRNTKNAAALAANQIGISKKLIVIQYQGEEFELINPEIISRSGEQYEFEGCLSFPGYSGIVKRSATVRIKYCDRNQNVLEVERSGPLAICFQHEIDHLQGILFIDKMIEDYLENDETQERIKVKDLLLLTGKI